MTKKRNAGGPNFDNLMVIADQFKPRGKVTDVRAFGNGNINETFLVTLHSPGQKHFILQRINTRIFLRPDLLMQNLRTLNKHLLKRLKLAPLSDGRRWRVPNILLTQDAQDHWIDHAGSFWRAINFIEAAQSFSTIQDFNHAREVGYAIGMFHNLISDLPPATLADTLEGFHITPLYLCHYDKILAQSGKTKSPDINYCLQFVSKRRASAYVLEDAKMQGKLPLRPIHGDPKVDNVMIDIATRQAISVVDLDTVKPGLIHYDIGDCLRSCCNPLGEELEQWETVRFEVDICRVILQGYLSQARYFLTDNDFTHLYDAIRLIAYELGLRFFTDYLEGNVYFRVQHEEHNLVRALIQFKLTESIESQAAAICAIIKDMRR
ncbi:MAG: phosphotransferase enzyme family protein [Dissulfurispiraceae bacterium]